MLNRMTATGGPRAAHSMVSTCAAPVDHIWPWALVARHRPRPGFQEQLPSPSLSCMSLVPKPRLRRRATKNQYAQVLHTTSHPRAGQWACQAQMRFVFETNTQFWHQISCLFVSLATYIFTFEPHSSTILSPGCKKLFQTTTRSSKHNSDLLFL